MGGDDRHLASMVEDGDPGGAVEFRVLGTVDIRLSGRALAARRPQQNAVLAALVVDTGRLVPVEVLVDRVWGQQPPPQARRALHTHVARIRRQLEAVRGTSDDETVRLVRRAGGYLLEVDPDRVDVHRFRRLVERARAADDQERARLLRDALALWQGEPLAGVPGEWAGRVRETWRQDHLDAVAAWAQAELRLGSGPAQAVISPLT
jgi:DNA-binding SARP family transcriptional activator